MTTCLTCARAALRDPVNQERDKHVRRLAALGCINCTLSDLRASFHAADHTCEAWTPAPEATQRNRQQWAAKLQPA